MKRIHFVKLLFVALLVSGSLNAWGAEVTFTPSDYAGSGGASGSGGSATATKDGVTIASTKAYVDGTTAIREYSGGKLTISSSNTISKIVITATSSKYAKWTTKTGSISTDNAVQTWTGASSLIELNADSQCRWNKIVVTYESGSTETTPSITQHPKSATYDQGATPAKLTITASGNPTPTYQWYSNTSNKNSNGTVISGETKDSYTPSTASTGIFYYYCVATNSQGSASSNVATITVNTVTTYTVQWMVGGAEYIAGNPTTNVTGGSKVTTLPDAPADNSLSCAEKFMGWSAQHIGTNPQDDAPADLFTTADASPAIIENTTFYAVFAKPKQSE